MWGFGKRSRKRRYKSEESSKATVQIFSETYPVENSTASLTRHNITTEAQFAEHISKYIGETVTIFVTGGGVSGAGFTGVLIKVNNNYLQLISRIGPFPSCTIYNTCMRPLCQNKMDTRLYSCPGGDRQKIMSTLGSSTYIPIGKIVSFVHNSV